MHIRMILLQWVTGSNSNIQSSTLLEFIFFIAFSIKPTSSELVHILMPFVHLNTCLKGAYKEMDWSNFIKKRRGNVRKGIMIKNIPFNNIFPKLFT